MTPGTRLRVHAMEGSSGTAGRVLVIVAAGPAVKALVAALTRADFAVDSCTGEPLEIEVSAGADLIILDLEMFGARAIGFVAGLRDAGFHSPIIAFAVDSDEASARRAIEAGVDRYLAGPIDPLQIVARCRSLLRRVAVQNASVTQVGCLQIDAAAMTAHIGCTKLNLSHSQFAILEQLARRAGQVATRQLLLDRLYGGIDTPSPGVVDVFIHALRRHLAAAKSTTRIETVRGIGFCLHALGNTD